MSWFKGALAGATVMAAAAVGAGPAPAASLGGIAPASPAGSVAPLVEKVHGYHRRCRWSSRLGSHRHRYGRVRFCDDGPGIYFNFGYYYGPYLYWGPPIASYRGHRRGRRIEGHRHRRGYLNRLPGFRSGDVKPRYRMDRPRVGNRNQQRRLHKNRVQGFQSGQFQRFRANRGRIQGNRQFRQLRGNGQRQLRRRKDSALTPAIVMTSFQGWSSEVIGTLPMQATA
ncbi:MAG: hypothetical protein U1E49_01170 [Hyphomicrobiaceae bacterium]